MSERDEDRLEAEVERLTRALSEVTNERDALAKGVKISIPTNTMEQEFRLHYDRGYRSAREAEGLRIERLETALRHIAITEDADCAIAKNPQAMTRLAREALK